MRKPESINERGVKMKKEHITIIAIIAFVALMLGIRAFTTPDTLGNMSKSSAEAESDHREILFQGEEGAKVKFSFRSNVKSGSLDIVLYDSEGTAVYELDSAKALETYYTFEKTDTYTLAAECSDFVGNYSVTVYKGE